MTIQDWAMTYDELEPYYDKFDKLCGVSGKAGNLRGQKIPGGNVFEGPRQNEYPNPPLKMTESALMFEKAAKELGYNPFPQPISNSSQPYTNSEGLTLGACQYCGHCERAGCEAQRQGRAAGLYHAGVARRSEVHAAHRAWRQPADLRQGGEEGDGWSTPTRAPARNTSSRRASWCCRPMCSATSRCCSTPASASPTIRSPARARSARTIATSSRAWA